MTDTSTKMKPFRFYKKYIENDAKCLRCSKYFKNYEEARKHCRSQPCLNQ